MRTRLYRLFELLSTAGMSQIVEPSKRREPKTYDFGPGRRFWGHNYSITDIRKDGRELDVCGWWEGIEVGDTILLENHDNEDGRSAYRVKKIKYYRDPRDMWSATLVHDPSPRSLIEGDFA